MEFPAVACVNGRPYYHTIGFLSIGILHKNSCENLLNLPLDKKLGAPQSSARRQFYHIQGTLSIVKVNKKNHPNWVIFHFFGKGGGCFRHNRQSHRKGGEKTRTKVRFCQGIISSASYTGRTMQGAPKQSRL